MKKYKDIIAGSALLVFGLIYFGISFSIKLTYIDRVVGSRAFPQICGLILIGLAAALIVGGVRQLHSAPAQPVQPNGEQLAENMLDSAAEKPLISPALKTFLVLVSFALFCWLLDKIGFGPASFLYLFSQMVLISSKKLTAKSVLFYLVLSGVLAAGIYYLFYSCFSLMLPKASWF